MEYMVKVLHATTSSHSKQYHQRILVPRTLPLGQAVLVTDTSHQVFEACDPSSRFLAGARHEIKGLHVLAVVQGEATVGVKAALGITLEDLGLLTLTHFPNGIYRDWCRKKRRMRILANVYKY